MRNKRYRDWLLQAKEDLKWAADSIESGHFAGVCFLSQQVAEKALKSVAYFRGVSEVRSHSVKKIAEALEINSEIARSGAILDQYYITTRYPDALPEGHPAEFYDRTQAQEALELAEKILRRAESELEDGLDST